MKLWDVLSTRSIGMATKIAMAIVLSQKVQTLLNTYGIQINPQEFQTTVPVAIAYVIERLHQHHDSQPKA